MSNIKELFKKKRSGFYFALITLLITLFSFFQYMSSANDNYGYDSILILLYIVAIIATAFFMLKDFYDIGSVITGILYAAIFGMFIKERFVYFITGILGISQNGIAPSMFLALLLMLAAGLINAFGSFFKREKCE